MDTVAVFGLGSLKALLMLLIAGGIALVLRGRPARLRAVIWGTALVGSLLIPLAATVVPALPVVLPMEIPQLSSGDPRPMSMDEIHSTHLDQAGLAILVAQVLHQRRSDLVDRNFLLSGLHEHLQQAIHHGLLISKI